jgi:hypothetical protein
MHDKDAHPLSALMRTVCPSTSNEKVPACAEVLSRTSAASEISRFMREPPREVELLHLGFNLVCDLDHAECLTSSS